MKINKIILVLLAIISFSWINAQERGLPIYKDYLTDNWYLLHPSMAGASNYDKLRITGRQAWFDVDDAPNLQTASVNVRAGDKVGLGAIFFNDENGRFSQTGGYLTFAYHLSFSRSGKTLNQLSFGASVGIIQESLDETDIDVINNPDPIISGTEQSETFFNADIGASYNYQDFFIHGTVKNIIPQDREIFTEVFETDNQRQYLLSTGYSFYIPNSKWTIQPSAMFQLKEFTEESNVDINGKAFYDTDFGQVWGGLSYRRSLDGAEFTSDGVSVDSQKLNTISPFLGITINNFVFAYTYTYQPDDIVLTNSGFHQLTLGYNFGKRRSRYQCNCPAVNY
ncbi:PorP/SprF family type IX secretion system membrane protein [Flavobacteriaceae bacterium 14752]|uniref:PorP/SprF family type IX secretion system membrane protein n=1 Tax=Mesohalobacter salilacus TaxID=2491711 RepID=UPI000F63898C|nr:type IX secretion system membrane protein PorP/SprF [Flavobacteriaceae bacterium 14752]